MDDYLYINRTTLVFNDELKRKILILKSKYRLEDEINQYGLVIATRMSDVFTEIRIEFKKKEYFGTNSKPNSYALMCCFYVDLDKCFNWEDVVDQLNDNIIERPTREYIDTGILCCCGKQIKNYYIARFNNSSPLILGDVCIDKIAITYKFKQLIKEAKELYKLKTKYRICIDCKKYNIDNDNEERIIRCMECFKIYIKSPAAYRSCSICKELKILKTDEGWKIKCRECYYRYG